jgi:hypothetical protein
VGRGPASGSSSSQRNVPLKISDWACTPMVGLTFFLNLFRDFPALYVKW